MQIPGDHGCQFPTSWREAITAWAERTPLVTSIYLFGSRAKGTALDDSDIDLAFQTRADGAETAYTVAFFNKCRWKEELEAVLPRPVDLQYADPDEDEIVWPAVKDHGIRLK